MNQLIKFAVIAAIATAPVAAQSAPEPANPSGPYVGGGWGRFNLHVHNLSDVGTAVDTISDSNDNAWKVFVGYRLNPYWSVEGAYINFGQPGDRFVASGTDGSYRVKMSGFAPSVIGTIPLGPVELFGKVGYYFYDTTTRINFNSGEFLESKHSRSDFLYGAGVGITFMDHLHVRAEYERIHVKNATDSDAMWLTGAWRF
jgi:OOP family OmpA-OmpF porin